MTTVVLAVSGLALLALALWSRRGRTSGSRYWIGSAMSEQAVLLVLPGLGVALLAAAALQGYEPVVHQGRLWFALPLALGLLTALYGALGLPLPRALVPGWLRARRARDGRR